MTIRLDELLIPVNPDDFVGQEEAIEAFQQYAREIIAGQSTPHLVIISGRGGSGRTSLARKCHAIAQFERINTLEFKVPLSPKKFHEVFNNIKISLDELKLSWRTFLERGRGVPLKLFSPFPGERLTVGQIERLTATFMHEIVRIGEKLSEKRIKLMLISDNAERFYHGNMPDALRLFLTISASLDREKIPLYFVITVDENTLAYLQDQPEWNSTSVLHIQTEVFEYSNAELFLRRRSGLVKQEREEILKTSHRTPLDLLLRWALKNKGLPFDVITRDNLNELFGFSPEEQLVLEKLSLLEKNYFTAQDHLDEKYQEGLNALEEKGFIEWDEESGAFRSLGIFDLFSLAYRPADIFTDIQFSMRRLQEEVANSLKPSEHNLKRLKSLLGLINDHILALEIGSQLGQLSQQLVQKGYFQSGLDVMLLAQTALSRGGDIEKVAELAETISRALAKEKQDYFAAKLFETAGEMFGKLNVKWRSQANYREAGTRYRRIAQSLDEKQHFMKRYLYLKSIECMAKAEETRRAEQFCSEAKKALRDYAPHESFFSILEKKIAQGEMTI